jgi:hypothetical protein
MDRDLIVLYKSEVGQKWALYCTDKQADDELALMSIDDESIEECARIWINKTAEVQVYNV